MNKEMMKNRMKSYALTGYGRDVEDLTDKEKFDVLSKAIMEEVVPRWHEAKQKPDSLKNDYYQLAEF